MTERLAARAVHPSPRRVLQHLVQEGSSISFCSSFTRSDPDAHPQDSLWQADDVEAVFDQDPQRVCILQGPVAVKHCKTTSQPIGELLGGIESSLSAKLLAEYYGGDASSIPTIAYLAPSPLPVTDSPLVKHAVEDLPEGGQKHVYTIDGELPPTGAWLDQLAGPKLGWLQAFLSNVSITHGKQTLPNPVKRVLAPRAGQRVELSVGKDGQPVRFAPFSCRAHFC